MPKTIDWIPASLILRRRSGVGRLLCFAATNLAKGMHPYPIEQSV